MKVAVISFSGNVGKTTIVRHLLAPRMPGARVLSVKSTVPGTCRDHVIQARKFGDLQELLQVVDDAIVDIDASTVEDLLAAMDLYSGSHEDFDCFVVPTVPGAKQQQDTIATLVELAGLGVPAHKVRLLFNMVEDDMDIQCRFELLLAFAQMSRMARVSLNCRLGKNEIYDRLHSSDTGPSTLAADRCDYTSLIATVTGHAETLALARRLVSQRLATDVVLELDACFAALALPTGTVERAC